MRKGYRSLSVSRLFSRMVFGTMVLVEPGVLMEDDVEPLVLV